MKVSIRRGMFETNSSSMHSICVVNKKQDKSYSIEDAIRYDGRLWGNELTFDPDDLAFGRYPFRMLTGPIDKAAYVIASFGTADKVKEVEGILSPFCKEGPIHIILPKQRGLIVEYIDRSLDVAPTGRDGFYRFYATKTGHGSYTYHDKEVDHVSEAQIDNYGYVDHQSEGLLQDFLNTLEVSLTDFILDPRIIAVIDGDEYCEFEAVKHSGIIDVEHMLQYDGDITVKGKSITAEEAKEIMKC